MTIKGSRMAVIFILFLVGCGNGIITMPETKGVDMGPVSVPVDMLKTTFEVAMRPGTDAAAFARGQKIFEREFTKEQGLGPGYNATSCKTCHQIPTVGGEGDLMHTVHGMPRYMDGVERMFAGGEFFRVAPPLFGNGYLNEVPRDVVEANCGVDQALGIHGVAVHTGDGTQLTRFGHKSVAVDLLAFCSGALFREMGLNNHGSPNENASDGGPDEIGLADIQDLVAFVAGLERPPAIEQDPAGRALFESVGCATCHLIESKGLKRDGTDLCAHDLGPMLADNDGEGPISVSQWRTAPLLGIRFRKLFMRDGRATNMDGAIRWHGGEAAKVVERYSALEGSQRDLLIKFVLSM